MRFITVLTSMFVIAAVFCLAEEPPKTVITGDQMEIIKGGQSVIFTGTAKVRREKSSLDADKIVQNKTDNSVTAEGNVKFSSLTSDNEPVSGRSGRAFYQPDSGKGELWDDRPNITYFVKTSTGPLIVNADRIAFDQQSDSINAKGSVEILTSSATAYAPDALYMNKEKKVYLTGSEPRPNLIYVQEDQKADYKADRITVFVEGKKVLMEGSVNGVMNVKDDEGAQEGTTDDTGKR